MPSAMPPPSKAYARCASTSTEPNSFCRLPSTIEHRRRANRAAVAFVDVGPNDHVDESRFVLEGEKDEALGGAGALARDHQPADAADAGCP